LASSSRHQNCLLPIVITTVELAAIVIAEWTDVAVGAAAKKVAVKEALDAKHLLWRQEARELMDAIKARQLAKAAKDVKRRAIADRACMVRQATANVAKRKAKAAKRKAKAADAQDASNAPDAKAVGPAPDAELKPSADAEVLEPAPDAMVLETGA
jgi:cell division septum initiation protein DivIVA